MSQEYLVKGESLTAVADKIRILNGTTENMSLDAMATNIGAANSEVDSQTELLAQAIAALEGKAGGGVNLPALNNPATASDILYGKEAIDSNGNAITGNIATYDGSYECSSESTGGGSGEVEIGVFTISGYVMGSVASYEWEHECPFIIGQTWQEWVNSPLNIFISSSGVVRQKVFIFGSRIRCTNGAGITVEVSTNGNVSGAVSINDLIQNNTHYLPYPAGVDHQ